MQKIFKKKLGMKAMEKLEGNQNNNNVIKGCSFVNKEIRMNIHRLIKEKHYEKLNELAIKCIDYCLSEGKSEKKWQKNTFPILYLCLLSRRSFTSLEVIELFDVVLKRSSILLGEEIDKIDKNILNETLRMFNSMLEQKHTLELNFDNLISFLIRCMYKSCKIDPSSKLLALSALKKIMEEGNKRDKIIEQILYDLNLLGGGRVNLGSKFILMCYEKNWFGFPVYELFNMLFDQTEQQFHYTEEVFLNLVSKINQCGYSLLLCLNFIKYFTEVKVEERGFSIFLRIYKEILNVDIKSFSLGEDFDLFCKKTFNLENVKDVYKYVSRKGFLFCLDIISRKVHPKRIIVAKALLKMDLSKVLTFSRKKIIKMSKALLKSDQLCLFECSVQILSILKQSMLFNMVESLNDIQRKKIIFNYLKESGSEPIYCLYLELLVSESTREVEFTLCDMEKLSKAFYSFHSKEVSKYLELDEFKVTDIYTADLALWYSNYHPEKIDVVYLVSFFLKSDQQFLISKNINFYVKLIGILNNVANFLSYALKRKLIVVLKDLLFYTPYTKEVGTFFNNIGCNKFVISSKTEYVLVVLAACNHEEFKNRFLESSWSPSKDRALVFILRHQPEYGMNYKWRLLEILKDSDAFTILDLLKFLEDSFSEPFSEKFGEEMSNFYFSFIDENQKSLFELLKSETRSLSLQSSNLIYTAIKNKCLLAETSIPVFLSHTHNIPVDINQYEHVILKNINQIIQVRGSSNNSEVEGGFSNNSEVEVAFIYSLFRKMKDKKAFLENMTLETSSDLIFKTFALILSTNKNKYGNLISKKIRDFQITVEDEETLRKMIV